MKLPDIAKKSANFYAPRFEIEIEGQKLKGSMEKIITDLSITEKIDEGASFTFTIYDEFDLKKQEFKWLEHELFQVGNKITIRLGYGSDLITMIMGKITGIEPSFFAGEIPTITITGQDLSYDYIKRKSPERTFTNMTYSEIAETIASEAKLKSVVDGIEIRISKKRKSNKESYYQFLKKLAEEIGFVFFINEQTMYFVKNYQRDKGKIVLEFGRDILSFKPSLRTTGIVTEVEVRGHNPNDPSRPIVGKAKAEGPLIKGEYLTIGSLRKKIDNPVKKVVDNIIVTSVTHANSVARAILESSNESILEGEGSSIGTPQLRAGVNIRLEKIGKIFSGEYYVRETTHTINNNGYITKFSVIRSG
ncbi:MAG: hypothetical protein DRJ03_28165 [Chloroflexi bacterium]|nr:MAG: hypothetical protein DRJ03_28165 [Chloroflexota bacterium]